jgi:hypothetical protein
MSVLMNPIELYKLWAPDNAVWSKWAKPVLFTGANASVPGIQWGPWRERNVDWAPPAESRHAIILDLPEADSVWWGMALALRGYRPVPLYNGTSGHSAVISVGNIIGALQNVAPELQSLQIPENAPPVLLLDANRSGGSSIVSPGRFDNRWAVFPQDFPSANFMLSQGIRSVILGQSPSTTGQLFSKDQPARDLAHVLRRWQEAGLQILGCDVRNGTQTTPMDVAKPGSFRAIWYRAMVIAGFRRNSTGGFGAVVPEPSQSSGYG